MSSIPNSAMPHAYDESEEEEGGLSSGMRDMAGTVIEFVEEHPALVVVAGVAVVSAIAVPLYLSRRR